MRQGRWRADQDGYIEKGPFPKEKARINVSVITVKPETGETALRLTPRHAGESPIVYWSSKAEVSEKDAQVEDPDTFHSTAASLYFWVKDLTGQEESAAPCRWLADLKIRHQVEFFAGRRRVTLTVTPRADLYYTLDGSNPKDGIAYAAPFELDSASYRLLVFARAGEARQTADFEIPACGDESALPSTRPTASSAFSTAFVLNLACGSRACVSKSARAQTP